MEIICEQSQKDEEMYLQKFAFCGSTEVFKNNISSLAAMAEPEKWSFDGNANSLLIKYINAIFKQCYKQDRIMYTDDKSYACFNTGLLTPNGNDIIITILP